MKHTNTILVCILALGLSTTACKKKQEEQQAAGEPRKVEAPAAVADVIAEEKGDPQLESSLEDGSFAVNEGMPPMDEGGPEPKVLARGSLVVVDPEIRVSGEATLYEAEDGTRLLRLENLLTPAGFALEVAFAGSAEPKSPQDLNGRLNVGPLKGPSGNMNYTIDRSLNISQMRSLVLVNPGSPPSAVAYMPLTVK